MFTSLDPGPLAISAPLDEALHLAATNGFAALDLPVHELLTLVVFEAGRVRGKITLQVDDALDERRTL